MSDSSVEKDQGGYMVITLKDYLSRLERQATRQENSPKVPSLEELSNKVGIHPVTMSNIANNNIKLLNLATAGRIMYALRSYGFPTEIGDWLAYEEDEHLEVT